ncbi:MAG: hypothetical protein CMH28_05055 [Micavibrio sp.]|mgnify:FL=1|nr:hypothetical protein [Micavibrio sp.]
MSVSYLEEKIKEAIKSSGGNMSQARQKLLTAAVQDQALLLALVKPHLNGIASYAIDRVNRKGKAPQAKTAPDLPKNIDMAPETFGKDLLKALSGRDSVKFGMESAGGRPMGKRTQASQRHIDALKALAGRTSND